MIYLAALFFTVLSAFLWRVRGGLRFAGKKLPLNKIWYAATFACYSCLYFSWGLENWLIGFIACYVSYQLYGWGLYISSLLDGGKLNPNLNQYRECELIDDLLYSLRVAFKGKTVWLYEYPRLFGFCGTTLTGLIITFLWGLYLGNLAVMLSGLGMGICYWLGGQLDKLKTLGKSGWNWGEWIFGAYMGLILWAVL
jgi:hypothetical protein